MSKLELRYPKGDTTKHPMYYLDGKRVPSVTTVIGGNLGWNKRILMAWQSKLFREGKDPDKVRDEACDIGTLVHDAIEKHIYGVDELQLDAENMKHIGDLRNGLRSYIEWEEQSGVTYLESELSMGSVDLMVAGTADGIATIDGKTYLIDFKTSKQMNGEMFIQLGAYRHMIEENTNYKIDGCIILHIKKGQLDDCEERVVAHEIDNSIIDMGFETFKELRELHKTNSEFGKYLRKLKKESE